MHPGTRWSVVALFALAWLAACSSDDNGDDAGGASAASTGGSSASPNTGGAGTASATGGAAPSNAGAPAATGGRPAGFGGFAPTLGGNPVQGGSSSTQGGSTPDPTGGNANPGEPTLESLTPEELGALCADARASFDASGASDTAGELACRTAGIFAVLLFEPETDAELQRLCQETYDECKAEPLETEDDCEENSTCSATVSEFRACVDEYPAYLVRAEMAMPACSELTMANLEEALGFELEPTPACDSWWTQCPDSGGF